MEIKVNVHGDLMIKEAGLFAAKACPHREDRLCGDWCRLLILDPEDGICELCSTTLLMTSFVDERGE